VGWVSLKFLKQKSCQNRIKTEAIENKLNIRAVKATYLNSLFLMARKAVLRENIAGIIKKYL
jgi:hypothetical protein